MKACTWFSILKCYFIVVGLTYAAIKTADIEATFQCIVAIMVGNTARCMDRLEVQGHAPNSLPEFKKLFINKNAPLDNKNIARDKLHKLQQCGSI